MILLRLSLRFGRQRQQAPKATRGSKPLARSEMLSRDPKPLPRGQPVARPTPRAATATPAGVETPFGGGLSAPHVPPWPDPPGLLRFPHGFSDSPPTGFPIPAFFFMCHPCKYLQRRRNSRHWKILRKWVERSHPEKRATLVMVCSSRP